MEKTTNSATLKGQTDWHSQITLSTETELNLLTLLLEPLRESLLNWLATGTQTKEKQHEGPRQRRGSKKQKLDGDDGSGLHVANGSSH